MPSLQLAFRSGLRKPLRTRSSVHARAAEPKTGVVFMPFQEVQSELTLVSSTSGEMSSLARMAYSPECEAAVNEQINVEYNISYVYHALAAYFDRDNVGLAGFAAFFKSGSQEERGHAEMLMDFQNMRGGRVKLQALTAPEMEFSNDAKGDALYAMELALSLEKLNFQKLRNLHAVANAAGDAQMCDFIEGSLLAPQAEDVKEAAVRVSQLRRIGKGLSVWMYDKELGEEVAQA